jgi:2-isopropylmalate synthase
VLLGEDDTKTSLTADGDGPIAAAFQALEQVTGVVLTLKKFELHSASMGEDAQGEVTVTVEHDGDSYRGNGTSVDIVEAGSRACLEVMNRILRRRKRDTGDTDSTANVERATI